MNLLQAYYTSCRVGQSGASGFQFYSFSPGLTADELSEIEKIGNYISPSNLPSNPTTEDIDTVFPISFNYFRLKSGRVGVQQSVALAQDYSGRPGNYFSHTLVLEDGEFPFLPIYLYNTAIFRKNLSNEEWEINNVPEKLSILSLDKLQYNPNVNPDTIRSFWADGKNKDVFGNMLNAVLEQRSSKKRVILVDENKNIPLWIAVLTHFLPLRVANKIPFSTYSIDPANSSALICGASLEGSRFNFNNESAYLFQYYIFNNFEHKYSQIELDTFFAKNVQYDDAASFFKFTGNFNEGDSGENIDASYMLFVAQTNKKIFSTFWQRCLKYVSENASTQFLQDFFISYKQTLESIFYEDLIDLDADLFFNRLYTIYQKNSSAEDFRSLFDLYKSWLIANICNDDRKHIDNDYAASLLLKNEDILRSLYKNAEFSGLFINNTTITELGNYVLDTDYPGFYNNLILVILNVSSISGGKMQSLFALPAFLLLIEEYQKICNGNLSALVNAMSNSTYVSFVSAYKRKYPNDEITELIETYVNKEVTSAEQLMDLLCAKNDIPLLSSFLPFLLQKDKTLFWKAAISFYSSKADDKFDAVIKDRISDNLSESENRKLLSLVIDNKRKSFYKPLIEKLEANSVFNIPSLEEYAFLKKVCAAKNENSIKTTTDTFELLKSLYDVSNGNPVNIADAATIIGKRFVALPKEKQQILATTFLQISIDRAVKQNDYSALFDFVRDKKEDWIKEKFVELLCKRFAKKANEEEIGYILVNYLKDNVFEQTQLHELVVKHLVDSRAEELNKYADKFSGSKDKGEKQRWEAVYDEAKAKIDNQISNKFYQIVGKFLRKNK